MESQAVFTPRLIRRRDPREEEWAWEEEGRAGDGKKGHKKEMEEKITVSRGILRLILGVLFNTCSGLLRWGDNSK